MKEYFLNDADNWHPQWVQMKLKSNSKELTLNHPDGLPAVLSWPIHHLKVTEAQKIRPTDH
jgi:hypothetical protein